MNTPYIFKKCSDCGEWLVATIDNFNKSKTCKYGLNSRCRKCATKYHKEYNKGYIEKRKKYNNEYFRGIQGKLVILNSNSRRRFKNYIHDITVEMYEEMINYFDGKCAYTNLPLSEDNFSFEHIIPSSLDGVHAIYNLLPCHKSINFRKHNKRMEQWYQEQPFYSEERLTKIYEWIEYSKNKYMEVGLNA